MSRLEELVQKFKQRGYKMTPQRRAILEALAKNTSHPTAEQIHETVRERMPDISLATVYNTLRDLAEMQELWELDLGHGVRYYEISRENHAHRVCLVCGRIEDVPADFEMVKSLFQCCDDFRPVRYAVTIYGYCADNVSSLDTEE
ncbi:MAG: transcriptional repressor [Anaerolineae bacterium]|nr:transcriptional repressor [Anaerolineae bacterium]